MHRQNYSLKHSKGQGKLTLILVLSCVSLLLLAAIISGGITYAKYVSEMYDFTGVTAGDFHFASNYLDEYEEIISTQYAIANWDGFDYSFDFEVRNFDNSLRYNESDQDCYYYIDAQIQHQETDENGNTSWVDGAQGDCTLEYVVKAETEDGVVDLVAAGQAATYLYVVKDANGNVDTSNSRLLPALQLSGMDDEFDRGTGTHKVTVKMNFDGENAQTEPHKLILRIKSIPASDRNLIVATQSNGKSTDFKTIQGQSFSTVYNTPSKYSRMSVSSYPAHGIYGLELGCNVVLTQKISFQEVEADYQRGDTNSQQLTYMLICNSSDTSALTNVRVYFNSKRLKANENMLTGGYTEFSHATVTIDGVSTEMVDDSCDVRYFNTTVQSSSITTLLFYTNWFASADSQTPGADTYLNIPKQVLEGNNKINYDKSTWVPGVSQVPDIWFEILDEDEEIETYATLPPETMPTETSTEDTESSSTTGGDDEDAEDAEGDELEGGGENEPEGGE